MLNERKVIEKYENALLPMKYKDKDNKKLILSNIISRMMKVRKIFIIG